MPRVRYHRLLAAVFLAGLVPGCGSGSVKLYPVRGQVFFEGQPAAGATVVFHPAGAADPNAPRPSGKAADDGSFTLTSYPHGDGAPAGEYVVLVSWFPPNAREVENPKNKLPARYADAAKPQLKATVQAGATEVPPFRLTR